MNQAETQFKLDLQLFTEGDAPGAEPSAEPPAQEPSTPAATEPDSYEIDYSQLGRGNSTDQLDFLKKHGFLGNGQEPSQEPSQLPTTEPSGQPNTEPQQPPEPEFEIKVNGEVKRVKHSELINYAQMGFDYTQKTQDLAAQRRQLDAMLAAQVQNPPQSNPVQQTEQEYKAVIAQTEKELGLQPGEYNQFDPVHQFAFNRVTMQYNSYQLAQKQVQGRISAFAQQVQADPLTAQVDVNFDTFIYKMGAEGAEGAQKANALLMAKQRLQDGQATMQDLDLLEAHWNAVKTALSAKPAKPVPVPPQKPSTPPKTETPGSSVEPPKVRMDYKKLGGMKQSDQLAYLRQAGFFKRGKDD